MKCSYLLPVGSNDANVSGMEFGQTFLSVTLQEFFEVADENLYLAHIEKGRTVCFSVIFSHHPMEYHWKALINTTK